MLASIRSLAAALGVSLAVAGPAGAEIAIYQCGLTVPARSWITDLIVIGHDLDTGAVTINDAVTNIFAGGPVAGRVATVNDNRITFAWEVPVQNRTNARARMIYRGTFLRRGDRFVVSAQPAGYGTSYQARGRCDRTVRDAPLGPGG